MQFLRRLFIIITIITCCLQAHGADKYTDENRPYEFGFNIEGEQHRHEKKDENGIIMGEFGFITADGVYHVTVYATDENGNFKILSMKNIRVKPYPTGPERKGHSLPLPPTQNAPQAHGPTPQPQKPISIEPPAKSCSHCSIPTSSTQAPQLTDSAVVSQDRNPPYGGNGPQYNQPGAPPNYPNPGAGPNYSQPGLGGPNNQQNYPNQGAEPNYSQQGGSDYNQQGSPDYNQQGGPAYNPQGSPGYNQQGSPDYNQQGGPAYNQQGSPGYNQQGSPAYNQQGGPAYNQQGDPAYNQQGGSDGAQYPQQAPPASGDRNPKQFNPPQGFGGPDAGQQYGGADGFGAPQGSTGPNKPTLISAQMQIVDKNTDIHQRGPGEREGLPDGLTKDDMTRLLYTFNYTVGFHGHHEEGYVNGAKVGYYYVTGRNGVRTRVDYVADEKGFRPKITQEVLDLLSDDVPKPETEKDEKYGLKGYEFKWLYYPENPKRR